MHDRDANHTQAIELHGQQLHYRTAGEGPVVLLVHGMAGCSDTWRSVLGALAERYTVVAPDLPGHGASAKGRNDYSLGAFASCLRDLLAALGHDRATLVGQSLGGGVVMQFAYQFPERCERLVLVSSGGLGREVSPLLRGLAFPGSEFILPLVCNRWLYDTGTTVTRWIGRLGLRPAPYMTEIWSSYGSLADAETRAAFVHTLRSVVDHTGQRVSARDRLHLATAVPTLVIWGDADRIIPVQHAYATHQAIPGSRLEVFAGAGHFPHCEQPARFVAVLHDFVDTTVPARFDDRSPGAAALGA